MVKIVWIEILREIREYDESWCYKNESVELTLTSSTTAKRREKTSADRILSPFSTVISRERVILKFPPPRPTSITGTLPLSRIAFVSSPLVEKSLTFALLENTSETVPKIGPSGSDTSEPEVMDAFEPTSIRITSYGVCGGRVSTAANTPSESCLRPNNSRSASLSFLSLEKDSI